MKSTSRPAVLRPGLSVLVLVVGLARAGVASSSGPLLLGPVEGFTTQWCVVPGTLAFPRDRSLVLRQYAPPGASVRWAGAQEMRRDARSSFARAEYQGRSSARIAVVVDLPAGGSSTSRVLVHWIDLQPEDLVVGPPRVKVWGQDEERRPLSVLRAELEAAAGTGVVTTIDAVGFLVEVEPAAAAPLVEWRFYGRALPVPAPGFARPCSGGPAGAGVLLRSPEAALLVRRFEEAGDVAVEVGPPGRARALLLHVRDSTARAEQAPEASPQKHDPSQSWTEPLFEEISVAAGIDHVGASFGVSWGFANGDAYPDVWCSNHSGRPSLYLSLEGEGFVDVASLVVVGAGGDSHGGAFADFDRDGDTDILQLVGASFGQGSDPNHLFVATHGLLIDAAELFDLDYPEGRGRTPVWMDWNGDSLQDALVVNFQRPDGSSPTTLFQQDGGVFRSQSPQVFFGDTGHHRFAQVADLSDDGIPEVIVHGFPHPSNVFFLGDPEPVDQTANLGIPRTTTVFDAAVADFNGDLRADLFLARNFDDSGFLQDGGSGVDLHLVVEGNEEGIRVAADGSITVSASPPYSVTPDDLFIGAGGWHPAATTFVLDAGDDSAWGMPPHVAGVDDGVYVWRDPEEGTWELRQSWSSYLVLNFEMTTGFPITAVSAVGFDPLKPPPVDRLLLRQAGEFVDFTAPAGLEIPVADISVGAGDFDNDRDVDLYLVCLGPTRNLPNRYFENDGTGVFVERPAGAGAAGSGAGRGESVAVADHDLDGFLDLFVVNGEGAEPFNRGPHQLFRNRGNTNHWIEVRLVGTSSNLEAIGARVLATAGGVTQLREQGGGMHCWSQDLPVLHFGLGPSTTVDLQIRWPSGTLQEVPGLAADQVITLVEP